MAPVDVRTAAATSTLVPLLARTCIGAARERERVLDHERAELRGAHPERQLRAVRRPGDVLNIWLRSAASSGHGKNSCELGAKRDSPDRTAISRNQSQFHGLLVRLRALGPVDQERAPALRPGRYL